MINNNFVIKDDYIKYFKEMIEDIKAQGKTFSCPIWDESLIVIVEDKCTICREYFKKVKRKHWLCPCSLYTPDYLIRFLKKVISNSIKGD